MYFGPPKTLAPVLRLAEGELRDRAADPPLDPLGAKRNLVVAVTLAPLARAVRIADRHTDDRDRGMHSADREDPGNPPSGSDDHLPTDLLAEDPVWRAHVVTLLGGHRRRLEAETVRGDRARRLVDDAVVGLPAASEEVEPRNAARA